jgi:hypothetical protein
VEKDQEIFDKNDPLAKSKRTVVACLSFVSFLEYSYVQG